MMWQPTLGAEPEVAVGWESLTKAERRYLGSGSWVDHLPGWMTGGSEALPELLANVGWRAERRRMYSTVVDVPRLTAFYPRYESVPSPSVVEAGRLLSLHYEAAGHEPFRTAGLCLYRDGRDAVAWHGDRIGRGAREDLLVAILSLGSARTLALRPRGGGSSLAFTLRHGDLLVMGGSCQREWDHSVPRSQTAVGSRVSVQFRPEGVA